MARKLATNKDNKRIRGSCLDCHRGITGFKTKRCRRCNGLFKRNNPKIDRRQYRRNWHIQNKYGMSPEEFESWWIIGKGKCFICNKDLKMPAPKRGQGLDIVAIDHDHKTGNVRGLLCNGCNKAIGLFNDNLDIIYNAFIYLGGKK